MTSILKFLIIQTFFFLLIPSNITDTAIFKLAIYYKEDHYPILFPHFHKLISYWAGKFISAFFLPTSTDFNVF